MSEAEVTLLNEKHVKLLLLTGICYGTIVSIRDLSEDQKIRDCIDDRLSLIRPIVHEFLKPDQIEKKETK